MSALIDFKELELAASVRGEGLEQLTRELGNRIGCLTSWAGRGADRGRDIFFVETLSGPIYRTKILWLVSCKDHAKTGASVSPKELAEPGVIDKVTEHRADGYLLVTTTTASTNTKETLDKLDKSSGGSIYTQVWDGSDLTRMLLKPANHDLLQQFFPQSYQRVKGLTTLEGALLAFADILPAPILDDMIRLAKPYTGSPLKGSVVWPYNNLSAQTIDRIVKCLLIDEDIERAVFATEEIEFDAFLVFIDTLHKKEPDTCYTYLFEIVRRHHNADIQYNALQILLEHYEISPDDTMKLAQNMNSEAMNILFDAATINEYVEDQVSSTSNFEVHQSLAEISNATEFGNVFAHGLEFKVGKEQQINFKGMLDIEVMVYGCDEPGQHSYQGMFEGYLDVYGMYVNSITLDHDKYFSGNNLSLDFEV